MEIVKAYAENSPAVRFIGKKYGDGDRVGGTFGFQWGQWFENGWFDAVKRAAGEGSGAAIPEGGACLGLMRHREGEPFEYWIGMFCPEGAEVPEGYGFVDFPPSLLGAAWLLGPEAELYMHEGDAAHKLWEAGYEIVSEPSGATWFFERYVEPRFTAPDAEGRVILDVCFFVKPRA